MFSAMNPGVVSEPREVCACAHLSTFSKSELTDLKVFWQISTVALRRQPAEENISVIYQTMVEVQQRAGHTLRLNMACSNLIHNCTLIL